MSNAMKLPTPVIIPVAGVSFRQGVVRSMAEGQFVILKRDRENEFDENAVALYTLDGDHIGFVPRNVAERLTRDDVERWGGEVDQVLPGKTWGLRVRVTHSNVPDYPVKPKHTSFIEPRPAELEPEELPDGAADAPVVFSKSGRQLGVAVDYDPTSKVVKVNAAGGSSRLYPAGVVIVKEADAVR